MPKEAQNLISQTSHDTTGMEEIFDCHDLGGQQDLTLAEAAKRLNIAERTVQRRLKQGLLNGYKVDGPRGPEWRIDPKSVNAMIESVSTTREDRTFSSDDTTVINPVASEDRTDNKEALTAVAISQFTGFYQEQIENLQEKLEAATYRNGYLEAQLSNFETQVKMLPDLSAKATKAEFLEQQIQQLESELSVSRKGWWSKFGQWFIGSKSE